MALEKQMELFENGGLKDEGGTIDPVSGNDVPTGSTKEEVRDDIPAQLSEGEFVLPADVVRYHGLDKIMRLRDEAKAGLARMEEMGQMGNSDEATIPDDVPFDINDLDIEEDDDYNMAIGGYVPPVGSNIAGYQPSAFTNYAPQYTPYQPVQYQQPYAPPQQQAVPMTQQPSQLPKFQEFVQAPKSMAPENRQYINPQTKEQRVITFINNQPTTPIPEGFVPLKDYKPEEAVVTPTTAPQPTTTTREGGEASERDTGVTSAQTAASALGYSTGTQSPAKLAGMLLGMATGIPGAGFLGAKAGQMLSKDQQETFGKYGTVDPGTGAVFGIADIPGIKDSTVAQGYNPITGQKMAVFSGTPSASYMSQQVKSAFGFAPSTYTKQTYNSPTPMGKIGLASTLDKAISNMKGYDVTQPDSYEVGDYSFQDISAEELGFKKGQAGYEEAANNSGKVGNNAGDIAETEAGVGVITANGQIKTSTGTVVQLGNKSLLGTKEENFANITQHNKEEKGYNVSGPESTKESGFSAGMASDAAASVSSGNNAGTGSAPSGNSMGDQGRDQGRPEGPGNTGSGSSSSSGGGCFEKGTLFKMYDGSVKPVEDIKPGDKMYKGGIVRAVMIGDGLSEDWYNYNGINVTSSHPVYDNGKWKRIKDVDKKISVSKRDTYYSLINEHHLMIAENNTVFTDFFEISSDVGGIGDLLIQLLNERDAEATAA